VSWSAPREGLSEGLSPRVLIVHGQVLLRQLLATSLGAVGFADIEVVERLSLEAVTATAQATHPDVVLLGSHLGETATSLALVAPLSAGGAMVLVLCEDRDPLLLSKFLEAGAKGLFNSAQSLEHLVKLIGDAALGRTVLEPWARYEIAVALRSRRAEQTLHRARFWALSDAESDVLKLLMKGHQAEGIAALRVVSVATVRSQIRSVLRKLGVNSQLAAVVLAEHSGWPFDREATG